MKYKSFSVEDRTLSYLVGRTVVKMDINDRRDVIRFILSDGEVIYASAVGDCCSRSWFEHIEGVEALIGHKILKVIDREMPAPIDKTDAPDYGSLVQFYGWTLETERGRFDIEMRNESNGYYGGDIIVSDVISDQYHSEVDEPFECLEGPSSAAGDSI